MCMSIREPKADVNYLPPFLCLSTLIFETSFLHWNWSSQEASPAGQWALGICLSSLRHPVFRAGVTVLPSSSLYECWGSKLKSACFTQAAISLACNNYFLWKSMDNISRLGTNLFRLSTRKYLEVWLGTKLYFCGTFCIVYDSIHWFSIMNEKVIITIIKMKYKLIRYYWWPT